MACWKRNTPQLGLVTESHLSMLLGDPVAVVYGFKGNASFNKGSLDKIGRVTDTGLLWQLRIS